MFFDWISIVYIVILLLGLAIGIHRGFISSIGTLIMVAVAFVAAIFLSEPIARAIMDAELGEQIATPIKEYVSSSLPLQVSMIPINSTIMEGNIGTGILEQAFEYLSIPSFLLEPLRTVLIDVIGNNSTLLGNALTEAITVFAVTLVAFAIVFTGVVVLFLVVKLIVWIIRHAARKKPSMLSRLGGGIIKLVEAFAIVYVISFALSLAATCSNEVSQYLNTTLRLNEEGWSLAKWMVSDNLILDWISALIGA